MDGENNGKPYKNGWFGGKTHYFRKHPFVKSMAAFDSGSTKTKGAGPLRLRRRWKRRPNQPANHQGGEVFFWGKKLDVFHHELGSWNPQFGWEETGGKHHVGSQRGRRQWCQWSVAVISKSWGICAKDSWKLKNIHLKIEEVSIWWIFLLKWSLYIGTCEPRKKPSCLPMILLV